MTTIADLERVFARSSRQFNPRTLAAVVAALPELPPATAPHGPNAARTVAQQHADNGHHSHLSAYGETVCLSRQCGPALDALRGLL